MDNNLSLLFGRIANGDTKAFKLLFEKWYDPLFHTALTYLKVPDLAGDVCQQVFLKIWERRQILREVEDANAWLYSTARYQAFHALKQEAKRKNGEMLQYKMLEAEGTPEEKLMQNQTEQIIIQSLAGLTERQRQAYILNRFEGLSFREIAEMWQVRTDTIKEHVTKASKHVRRFLSEHKNDLIILLFVFGSNFFD